MQRVLRGLLACAMIVACGAGCGSDNDDELVTPTQECGTHTDAAVDGRPPPPEEGGTPAMDGPMTCGEFGQSAACGTCLAANCCSEGAACRGNAACNALVTCRRACSGADATACLQDCFDQNATAGPTFNPLTTCMGTECETECPFATP